MTNRPISGTGMAHEENYVEERLEDAGSVQTFEQAADRLKQEVEEINRIIADRGSDIATRAGSGPSTTSRIY
ncbi:MAG: hypothetical protein NVS4B8_00250 [Herpetosiphon sp.]